MAPRVDFASHEFQHLGLFSFSVNMTLYPSYCWAKIGYTLYRASVCSRAHGAGVSEPAKPAPGSTAGGKEWRAAATWGRP